MKRSPTGLTQMTIETIVFAVVALGALAAALTMVLAPNAVHSALLLVGVQVCLAIMFLLQGAFFIAALQVIVYAGAIMVLFVFVVMLLGVDQKEAMIEPISFQRPLAIGLGALLLAEGLLIGASGLLPRATAANTAVAGEGNVEAVARVLFTKWSFAFEFTSVLLAVAIVGVMVLAKQSRGSE